MAITNSNCLEANRLNTFDRWPHPDDSICSKELMAKAGFFYIGSKDCVRCFVCQIKLENWNSESDEPWSKHVEVSPNCLFAQYQKEEKNLTVEQWIDILCCMTVNIFDHKLNKLREDTLLDV